MTVDQKPVPEIQVVESKKTPGAVETLNNDVGEVYEIIDQPAAANVVVANGSQDNSVPGPIPQNSTPDKSTPDKTGVVSIAPKRNPAHHKLDKPPIQRVPSKPGQVKALTDQQITESGPALSHQEREFLLKKAMKQGVEDKNNEKPFVRGYDDDYVDQGDEETVWNRIFHRSH